MMPDGNDKESRSEARQRLLTLRRAMSPEERGMRSARLVANLHDAFRHIGCRTLGLYWPIRHETDLRIWADRVSAERRISLALPVVVERAAPIVYRAWKLGDDMVRGFWNIPVPARGGACQPDVVIAPLVGFNGTFRLGYGGGYFDRTLAAAAQRPFAIGVGFDVMRAPAFEPRPHDIAMDVIVTDEAITWRDAHEAKMLRR